jgi:hypothetical protein
MEPLVLFAEPVRRSTLSKSNFLFGISNAKVATL